MSPKIFGTHCLFKLRFSQAFLFFFFAIFVRWLNTEQCTQFFVFFTTLILWKDQVSFQIKCNNRFWLFECFLMVSFNAILDSLKNVKLSLGTWLYSGKITGKNSSSVKTSTLYYVRSEGTKCQFVLTLNIMFHHI